MNGKTLGDAMDDLVEAEAALIRTMKQSAPGRIVLRLASAVSWLYGLWPWHKPDAGDYFHAAAWDRYFERGNNL